ncbi:DUF3291 domain-containing protein [Alicyclobacillus dauci]|uniref:DUF3291 domain-containing protein n=1 Tax=Alicyclobacillus dauci TaxID=1475485 RepID=A0ABY6Z8P4_9BACL|nr:DUF3291 domain-containing protein [Alicyclobacillus dauci]WAH39174.1 DUF3291 domain-containing protein [Alicyclobacillus dauci]
MALYTCPKLERPYDNPANKSFEELGGRIMEKVKDVPGHIRFVYEMPEPMPWPNYINTETDYPALTLSVWEDIDSLFTFSYRDNLHASALRQRKDWFKRSDHPIYVLWYVEDPNTVDYHEAVERMNFLCEHGPSPYAFDFHHLYNQQGNVMQKSK